MRVAPRPFFVLSAVVFVAAVLCATTRLPAEQAGVMRCSARVIICFGSRGNVNGTLHFNFAAYGKGSIVVEGYTDSAAGRRYLQRYVRFTWASRHISPSGRDYRINRWESSASPVDESPDILFDYFMREMADSHDGLFLNAWKLNEKAVLLGSIHSPLYICTLTFGSKLD